MSFRDMCFRDMSFKGMFFRDLSFRDRSFRNISCRDMSWNSFSPEIFIICAMMWSCGSCACTFDPGLIGKSSIVSLILPSNTVQVESRRYYTMYIQAKVWYTLSLWSLQLTWYIHLADVQEIVFGSLIQLTLYETPLSLLCFIKCLSKLASSSEVLQKGLC